MGASPADNTLGDSGSYKITGQIMLVAIIAVFVVVVFVLFLHLYAKWFWWRIEQQQTEPSPSGRSRRHRHSRFVFAPGQDPAVAIRAGLDPAVLKKIPVVVFNTQEFKDGLECAVCLCELEDGEKARLLPKCNHGFHVECIDMWFQSHSTCPLCRNPVHVNDDESAVKKIDIHEDSQESSLESGFSTESSPNFPTNVLVWGNETQVNSVGACLQEGVSSSSSPPPSSSPSSSSLELSSGRRRGAEMLVIEIPASTMSEHLSSLSPEEESESPMMRRLRSLKRLLSREKRVSPCSSGGSDCTTTTTTSSACDVV